jgi:uncharacterized membrane protein
MEEGGLATFIPYTEVMLGLAQAFEIIAALTLLVGLFWSLVLTIRTYRSNHDGKLAYKTMRQSFGGAILLGLEILVAGDLIRTVAVYPTLENVGVLAIIVLIRTVLSFSLEIEIEGVPPWRRALVSGATVMKQATTNAKAQSDG